MAKNQEEEILDLLKHSGSAFRGKGIATCIKKRIMMDKIAKRLKELKEDGVYVLGRPISSYATAALDILGAEKYTGDDQDIKDLIDGLPGTFKE